MSEDRFCKRCSVTRVNALCQAYEKAHQPDGARHLARLRSLVELAAKRDYPQARGLLTPGLGPQELRALCFNVASFLSDEEVKVALG